MQRTIAIVGAGLGGIGLAIRLKQAGIHSFTIFERSDGVGGTWHHNTYPGAACDVPSYLYSFSFEPRYDWSRPCPTQEEIHRYVQQCVDKYDLREHIRLNTEITRATFDPESARWTLKGSDPLSVHQSRGLTPGGGGAPGGETFEADVVVTACGQLHRPAFPNVPGLESFAGEQFHSAEWDHDVALDGKRVAIVGTGASAVQFIPHVAERAAHTDVYQRTAQYVLPRRNKPYRPWARAMFRLLPPVQQLRRLAFWLCAEIVTLGMTRKPWLMRPTDAWFRWYLGKEVADPELRAKLTPDYRIGTKRILFTSFFYSTLRRPDVELVTDAIREVTPTGIVTTDGVQRPVDVIIYGTGFKTHAFVAPMEVEGPEGTTLADAWRDGPEAYLGVAVSGFPNLFLMYGPNTNLGAGTIIHMLESQVRYIARAVEALDASGAKAIDVRPEVQRRFADEIQARLRDSVWATGTSWYRAASGKVINNWPGTMSEYRRRTARVALEDYHLVHAARQQREPEAELAA